MNSNRRRPLYLALAVLPMAGMSFSLARADDPHAVAASTHDDAPLTKAAAEMADAASRFWAALTPEQQQTTGYKFDDDERFDWHFIPKPRKGLTIKEMTQAQRDLAHALLSTGLSHKGYLEASTIMSLEPVLFDLEQGKGQNKRDSELYYFTIFGKPGNEGAWGWRVEGHHFSLNVTIVDGKMIAAGPAFFGSNPAEVREGPRAGLRVLGEEEDRGRALIKSLDDAERKVAIFDETAPKDIITFNKRK